MKILFTLIDGKPIFTTSPFTENSSLMDIRLHQLMREYINYFIDNKDNWDKISYLEKEDAFLQLIFAKSKKVKNLNAFICLIVDIWIGALIIIIFCCVCSLFITATVCVLKYMLHYYLGCPL